jgi:Amidohydrolase family
MTDLDVVLRGGRVIDPESGLDAVRDVAIARGRLVEIGAGQPPGRVDVDVAGLVVTAGFVDLHSHAQDIAGLRLQACDGVTTALELEAGVTPVGAAYGMASAEGRPVNYGFAASWALARMEALARVRLDGTLLPFLRNIASPAWQRPARREEITAMLARLSADLANSSSLRHVDRVLDVIGRAQAAGARISTEAYPYGSGMTAIGAAFLAPERLGERDLSPSSLTYAPTGERVASVARLRELRHTDPGGLVIIHVLDDDDPADRPFLLRPLLVPGTVVASDAMPLTWTGPAPDSLAWPLPPTAVTHPRTAGTFSRALRLLTRDGGPFTLAEALSKCSLRPARLLQRHVPDMARKGRMQEGSDADIVVFDPDAVSDQATYADSTRPSTGIRHVLVNGIFIVRDGNLVTGALPGRPIRASPR